MSQAQGAGITVGGGASYAGAGGGIATTGGVAVADLTTGAFIPAGVASEATICTAAAYAAPAASAAVAGLATVGLYAGIALAATVGVGALLGILKTVLGPFRLAPSTTVTLGGLPAMKQLSWSGALKQLESNIVGGVKQALNIVGSLPKELAHVSTSIEKLFGGGSGGSGASAVLGSVATAGTSTATTRVNPFGVVLSNNVAGCNYFSTATTSTIIYLAGHTGTSVGSYWLNTIQPALASTASNGYQSIFFTAKVFTDALCSVPNPVSLGNVLTIEEIILDAATATTVSQSIGIITPSLETFAGTLYNPNYINSASFALLQLIVDANTSTTTLSQLQQDKLNLDLMTNNLLNQVVSDLTNQSKYINHSSQISSLSVAASTYNTIKNSQSNYVATMYAATINPVHLEAITTLSSLQDLTSPNTATVINGMVTLTTQINNKVK
jgi:hypothetical protein